VILVCGNLTVPIYVLSHILNLSHHFGIYFRHSRRNRRALTALIQAANNVIRTSDSDRNVDAAKLLIQVEKTE